MFVSNAFLRPGFATIALALGLCAQPVIAADTSAWDGDSRTAMRLLGTTSNRAGVELKLAPGWKTYWRYPGDAGVPPQFDFSGSDNLKSAQVAWPVPLRFSDAEGNTIGYKGAVVFPLKIEAKDAAQPIVLRLTIDYAICEKLCVPVQAKSELQLGGGSGTSEAAITEAEKRVPETQPLAAKAPLSISSATRQPGSPARVIVEVAAPTDAKVELFAEGPTPDWALPLPTPVDGAKAGHQRFEFALDGLPPGAKPDGAELKLTAAAGGHAIETTFRLD